MKLKIGIIDYGVGNLSSIRNTINKVGFKAFISSNHSLLRDSDLILLPGVGAFKPAMDAIKEKGLNDFIYEMVSEKTPILGICLGMQLLGRSSTEGKYTRGLNLIPEDVYSLEDNKCHIGWNNTKIFNKFKLLEIPDHLDFYFNHSYAFKPNLDFTVGETTYNGQQFTAIIMKDNIAGLQFHPEKSQIAGQFLLKKLIFRLCSHA